MKTFSTLFTSLLMSAAVFAADSKHSGMLTIKSTTPGNIRVIVDGKTFESGNNTVMIGNVDPGYHSISVFRMNDHNFFNSFYRKFDRVYSSSLSVSPATNIMIAIDRFGRADISESRIRGNRHRWNRHAGPDVRDYDSHGRDDNGRWEDNGNYSGYASPMTDGEFNQVMYSMEKEWFGNNKMKSASYIIEGNFFTTTQVKSMMSLFHLENNKLAIAEQAYAKTLDKENYRCITDELSFNGSKEALARYIRDCEQ